MCKYVRNTFMKEMLYYDKQEQSGEMSIKIRVTAAQINKILKKMMKEHNFERKVKPYNKTPASVTVENVNRMNELNRDHNEKI